MARRPLAVAITGGIGAGKSEALKAFARHGAPTLSSDEIVHGLLRDDAEVEGALVERWGTRVLGTDGHVDRASVGAIVFADRAELTWLEALLHPRVVATYTAWWEELAGGSHPPAVCVVEVPLLYEAGGEDRFDAVVVVTAPDAVREVRARVSPEGREIRLIPDDEKVRRADFVYLNTGSLEELDAWVAGVLQELQGRA